MTNHLTERELIEAADGGLSAERQRHVNACPRCSESVAGLGAVLADVQQAGEVPEPSPLFWDHFSRRVSEATADEPVPASAGPWTTWWRAAVVGVAMVCGVFLGAEWFADSQAPEDTMVAEAVPAVVETAADDATGTELDWAAVTAMARGLDAEAVEAIAPLPVAATPLVEDLNSRELEEFARLLRAEMGGVQ